MKTFPMFLQMTDRRVVIVGGDEQAAQKCRLILKTEAQIDVIAIRLNAELTSLYDSGRINWVRSAITAGSFQDAVLVFIATGCPGLDASIHDLAKHVGAFVNVVDQPALCDAITPAIVDRDPVVVAIGTEGTAPVLGRQIKTRVEQMLEPGLGDLANLAGRFRDLAARRLKPRERRDLWRWVFDGPVRRLCAKGSVSEATEVLKAAIKTGSFETAAPTSVALVDVGPGPRDLITLRGVRRLQEADLVIYDDDIDPGVLELARRDAERLFVGPSHDGRRWSAEQVNRLVIASARRGCRVVRLMCGIRQDTKGCDALLAAGVEYEVVPGASTPTTFATMGPSATIRKGHDYTPNKKASTVDKTTLVPTPRNTSDRVSEPTITFE